MTSAQDIGRSASRIYALIWDGEYLDFNGQRKNVNGDISKISQIIGLSAMEKALLQNYFSCPLESVAPAKFDEALDFWCLVVVSFMVCLSS